MWQFRVSNWPGDDNLLLLVDTSAHSHLFVSNEVPQASTFLQPQTLHEVV